jgi:hypothetical protein
MGKTLHFKSKEGYRRWLAYGHIHGAFKKHRKASKYPRVKIRGKTHRVRHRK